MATDQETPKEQICTFRIVVVVTSDEQALEYKKKVSAVFEDNPNAQTVFNLSNTPPRRPNAVG